MVDAANERLIHKCNVWGQGEVGTTEHPAGSNSVKYWRSYSKITGAAHGNWPWCGCYAIVRAFRGAKMRLPASWISVFAIQSSAEELKIWHKGSHGVKEGDVLVIGGPGVHTETAVMDAHSDGSVLTNGGNTSPGAGQGQFNGGAVAQKLRYSSEIYGYAAIHPFYKDGELPDHPQKHKDAQPQFKKEAPNGDLHQWTTGPRVHAMQLDLGMSDADGYYGKTTAAVVARWLSVHKITSKVKKDGSVVPQEMLAMLDKPESKPKVTLPRSLKRGDKGGLVRKLQRHLNKTMGGEDLRDDGDYGDLTAAKVKKFKQNHPDKFHGAGEGNVAGRKVWEMILK